jgi:hypothetical protein
LGAGPPRRPVQHLITGQERPMPGRWPRRRLAAFPVPWPARVDGKPVSSTYWGAPGKLAARSRSPLAAWPEPESLLHRALRDLWPSDPGSVAVRSDRQTLLARRCGTQPCGPALRRPCTGLLPTRRLPRSLPPVAARPPENLARALSGPQIIAAGIPVVAGVPGLAKTFLPGRIRQGPSMYEMEGPCPASPHQADQLAGRRRAPPAGARHPREGPVSRLLPRSRVAPGGTRFQR